MNDNDPWHIPESQLPEWLQREVQHIRAREALDRLKVALVGLIVVGAGMIAICAIARHGGIGA